MSVYTIQEYNKINIYNYKKNKVTCQSYKRKKNILGIYCGILYLAGVRECDSATRKKNFQQITNKIQRSSSPALRYKPFKINSELSASIDVRIKINNWS